MIHRLYQVRNGWLARKDFRVGICSRLRFIF